MKLSDAIALSGHRNNFTAMRLAAALCVVLSHSYALSTGNPANEPLFLWLGMSLGRLAVEVFFVTSGFLVCGSLLGHGGLRRFAMARAFRIFPALVVAVLLTAFVLGPAVSKVPLREYLSSYDVWSYVLRCSTIIFGHQNTLLDVFEGNVFPETVNGSLWSLRYEIAMYAALMVAWISCAKSKKVFGLVTVAIAAAFVLLYVGFSVGLGKTGDGYYKALKLSALFAIGACIRTHASKIPLSKRWLSLSILLLAIGTVNKDLFRVLSTVALPYAVIALAYSRPVVTLKDDYSYGVYIFSFPVQQAIMYTLDFTVPLALFFESASITLLLAYLSWHFVEKKAIAMTRVRAAIAPPVDRRRIA